MIGIRSTLRANLFPEVTDIFCRLPVPTLFYRLEADHLGYLMRLRVRPGVRINLSTGGVGKAPNTPVMIRGAFPSCGPYLQVI